MATRHSVRALTNFGCYADSPHATFALSVARLVLGVNSVVRHLAFTQKAVLFDFFVEFLGLLPALYLSDDIHLKPPYDELEVNFGEPSLLLSCQIVVLSIF